MQKIVFVSHRDADNSATATLPDTGLIPDELRGPQAACVLLDLTTDDLLEQQEALLTALRDRGRRVRLGAVVEETVPLRLLELLDGFEARFFPPDEVEDVLEADFAKLVPAVRFPERQLLQGADLDFATSTEVLFPVIEQIRRIARHDVTLLLVGETGTGKTTLARLVHELSPRCEEPFQHVACGALPPELIESELFGHVRGAFTGADRRKIGRFEAAGQGTLLLDEIDVLGKKEQAKLLRILETGQYEPVGSTETIQSEARLVAASNVELEELTEKDKFRNDLYYRLNVLELRLPPMRERPRDIVPMVMQFVDESCRKHGLRIDRVEQGFLERLREYPWPGNIRELKNHVQRAVIFADDGVLALDGLAPKLVEWSGDPAPGGDALDLASRVASTERALLEEALQKNGYKRTQTAKALGISRVGLYKKMRRLGLLESKSSAET